MKTGKFTWGKIINIFSFDFDDGEPFEVIKYNPWLYEDGFSTNEVDYFKVYYSSEKLHRSCAQLEELILYYIAEKHLGKNQVALVTGMCKAFDLPLD